jgi:capsule biosynthesis phosphatase
LDGTLTHDDPTRGYHEKEPNLPVVGRLREYKLAGFEIVIYSARNMRTHQNSIGKINAETLPLIIEWLRYHNVPYDEIYVGKPWCGTHGFYVDDRAIRPSEFVALTPREIQALLGLPDA